MKSNFEKVVDFNTQFGILKETPPFIPKLDIFTEDPKTVQFCLELIREEMRELEEAVTNSDFIETADALADLVYVIHGMAARIGINFDRVFETVHSNNMSKLCKTEEDAKNTVSHYQKDPRYTTPMYQLAPNNVNYVVINESTKKVLKSITWKPVNLTESLGFNDLLIDAVSKGHLGDVNFLIGEGADIHAYDDKALIYAARDGYLAIVELLILNGADIHACKDQALILASRQGHLEVSQLLLELGADIHACSDGSLISASEVGHIEIVKLLIEAGADIHAREDLTLRLASEYGHTEVVNYLKLVIEKEKSKK